MLVLREVAATSPSSGDAAGPGGSPGLGELLFLHGPFCRALLSMLQTRAGKHLDLERQPQPWSFVGGLRDLAALCMAVVWALGTKSCQDQSASHGDARGSIGLAPGLAPQHLPGCRGTRAGVPVWAAQRWSWHRQASQPGRGSPCGVLGTPWAPQPISGLPLPFPLPAPLFISRSSFFSQRFCCHGNGDISARGGAW